MDKNKVVQFEEYTKILVPTQLYRIDEDDRILIPYTCGARIGFINPRGEIMVKPQYVMYYGECYSKEDYVRVAVIHEYGFPRSGGKVMAYSRPVYGLIDYAGKLIFETKYFSIAPAIGNKRLFTVQDMHYGYAVLDVDGREIVPFGKYAWIDGYDNGLARVKSNCTTNGVCNNGSKWGLIDETGHEVLPLEYDCIWNFYGKKRISTKAVYGDTAKEVYFASILPSGVDMLGDDGSYHDGYAKDADSHYDEYAGTYAQDVAGYSDEAIGDAFDGEPDAYWNID